MSQKSICISIFYRQIVSNINYRRYTLKRVSNNPKLSLYLKKFFQKVWIFRLMCAKEIKCGIFYIFYLPGLCDTIPLWITKRIFGDWCPSLALSIANSDIFITFRERQPKLSILILVKMIGNGTSHFLFIIIQWWLWLRLDCSSLSFPFVIERTWQEKHSENLRHFEFSLCRSFPF